MGAPTSLLGNARAFARDFARDKMTRDYLWDVVDYVPIIIDAGLTGRGGWRWGTDPLNGDVISGLLATYASGDQLILQTTAGSVYNCNPLPPGNMISLRGSSGWTSKQNPIQRYEDVIMFNALGQAPPIIIRSSTFGGAPSPAPNAAVGTVWGEYVVTGGGSGEEDTVRFSHPSNDLMSASGWDVNSFQRTSMKVTGLGALRSVLIVFHAGSTERIRGSQPPATGTTSDDLNLEPLFARAGCPDPKAIAYWNENLIFADEHGVHVTDGAVIRNLVSQGGILTYWRPLWQTRTSLAACTFLDYYIITLRQSSGGPVTLICDLNARQWFRFSNIDSIDYIASGGSGGMERVWAGISGTSRTARMGPCFFPFPDGQESDDNGVAVLPVFETPWYRLAQQEGRKRVRFVYLSYDARISGGLTDTTKSDEGAPPPAPPSVLASLAPILEVSYIRSPQQTSYATLGQLPVTTEYRRFRLPVNQFPYGVAFKVRQLVPSTVTRVFDLGVEATAAERSRV